MLVAGTGMGRPAMQIEAACEAAEADPDYANHGRQVTPTAIRARLRAMAETVFSKIIRGELPCHKLFEDDRVLAFLDINPLCEGHTLVIPKEEVATVDQLSDESAAAIGRVLPRLSRAVLKATGTTEYNILQNNGAGAHQAVSHVHFHIIPKYPDGKGLGIGWKPISFDAVRAKLLIQKIQAAL